MIKVTKNKIKIEDPSDAKIIAKALDHYNDSFEGFRDSHDDWDYVDNMVGLIVKWMKDKTNETDN